MRYDELLELARELEGKTLETVTGRRFHVSTYRQDVVFIPESSGLGRADGRKAGERFVERFNETGSMRPRDYADTTRNASYYIGMLRARRRSSAADS